MTTSKSPPRRVLQQQQEYSAYNIEATSLLEYAPLSSLQQKQALLVLRIMHSEQLSSMRGIEAFTRVVELNLSSNGILRIEGLQSLVELQSLNLSCNKLQSVQGLANLVHLKRLVLSHNKITQIQGLASVSSSLEYLDLRNNKIQPLQELNILQNLKALRELYLHGGKMQSNPCCLPLQAYHEFLASLSNFSSLQKIDGVNAQELLLAENEQQQQNYLGKRNAQQQQQRHLAQPSNISEGVLSDIQNVAGGGGAQAVAFSQAELLANSQLREEVRRVTAENRQLNDRLSEQERYYQDEIAQLTLECRERAAQVRKLQEEAGVRADEGKRQHDQYVQKQEKKEQLVENLQVRVSELIRENGEQHRELAIRQDELQKLLGEQRELQRQLGEQRGQLREAERTLQHFHQQALENATANLLRNEEIRKKYEEAMEESKHSMQECNQLRERVTELLEICRELEYKYDKKVDEMNYALEGERRTAHEEGQRRERELREAMESELERQNAQFKENLDLLESEFKRVLMENNEKFRQLKIAFDERTQSEAEARQLMRAAAAKASEYEGVVQELQQSLMKMKREVGELMAERDGAQSEWEGKARSLQNEVDALNEERSKIMAEKSALERQVRAQGAAGDSEQLEERLRQRNKLCEQLQQELEEVRATISAKNKMLDDKNETIDDLHAAVEQLKRAEGQANDDYAKLLKKYERQSQVIEELEEQNSALQGDADQLQRELQDKKDILSLIDRELQDVKLKQEREVTALKNDQREKDKRVIDLLDLLDECKETLRQKDTQIAEAEGRLSVLQREHSEILARKYDERLRQKDREVEALQVRLREAEQDMLTLVAEMERQKRAAKENLEKLNKFFSV